MAANFAKLPEMLRASRDELTGDFGDGREAISIGVCDLSRRLVGKAVACILGLLQQNRP
jgi:hypothetical protein